VFQLSMISFLPHGFIAIEELQHPFSAYGLASGFHQERVSSSRTDDGVDFSDEIQGQQNVSALRFDKGTCSMSMASVS
jgi:hypothetical protein